MDVKNFPLAELKPYDKNPRKNDSAVDAVAKSIEQFGFKVPIVIDADNVIFTDLDLHTLHGSRNCTLIA